MGYPELIKRACYLWWRNRLLWPLGILAALAGYGEYGTSGNVNVNVSLPAGRDGPLDPQAAQALAALAEHPLVRSFVANPVPYLLGLAVLLVAWLLVAALAGNLAHGAMIRVAALADQGHTPTLGDGLQVGALRVWPLFLLSLLLALPALLFAGGVVAFVLSIVLPLTSRLGDGLAPDPATLVPALLGGLFCLVPLGLLVGLFSVVLSLFARIAQRCCVLEGRGPLASIARAWRLVRANLGLTLLNWVALAVFTAIFNLIAALPAAAILVPAMFGFVRSGELPVAAIVAALLYGLLAGVVAGGVLTSLNATIWTVLYDAFVARERAPAA